MKLMIPFLMAAVLPTAALAQSQAGAQSQSGGGSGVPSIAIPKTTEVIVIETPKQGVTPQQVMALIPEEIKATVKLYLVDAAEGTEPRGVSVSHVSTAVLYEVSA